MDRMPVGSVNGTSPVTQTGFICLIIDMNCIGLFTFGENSRRFISYPHKSIIANHPAMKNG